MTDHVDETRLLTAAFERLTALGQRTNRKLHDIAVDIVDTGEVPG